MGTIYLDEAGNTGANLLDPEQPFFVLASNDFATGEANALLDHVRTGQGDEAKFSVLRRRPEGIARIIRLLSDPRLNSARISIDVYHKRYMVVTKMVDLIAETLIHKIGGDLYERGGNIAMSNLLYYCMPVFCGETLTATFLQSFIDLIRHGPTAHATCFFEAGRKLVDASSNEKFKEDLFFFTEPALFNKWYLDFDWKALDPAIPALFHQILVWGERKSDRFSVVHDRSKPVLATQETFELMMAGTREESQTMGTDRRKIKFPLRASSLSQGESKQYPQIQVADLCAGSLNHFFRMHIVGKKDALSEAVEAFGCLNWGSDFLIPQPYVTPEQLGTEEVGGSNAVQGITEYLFRKTRNG